MSWGEALSTPDVAAPAQPRAVVDRDDRFDRAVAYVAKMEPAIAGQGGHNATWAVARKCAADFQLSEQLTLEVLRIYNQRCEPRWSDRDLEHKARDACEKARVANPVQDDEHWRVPREHYGWSARSESAQPTQADDETEAAPPLEAPQEFDEPPVGRFDEPETKPLRIELLSMAELFARLVKELEKPKAKAGVSTGNDELDYAIGGYRPGNITVFGAKRGFGKTSYGNFVTAVAQQQGYSVLLIAGEDPEIMYAKRFMARAAGLNAMMLRDQQVRKDDWSKIIDACAGASKDPFFWRTDGAPVERVAQAIREIGSQKHIDLVLVDYLQCIRAGRHQQDRRNEVTYVMGCLCDAIRAIGAAGLIFSQLRRTEREEPEVEDLKESGDIEDKAEHILLGWKRIENLSDNETLIHRMIKLAKNKDGMEAAEVDPQEQSWDGKTASFQFTGRSTQTSAPDDFDDLDGRYP